MLHLILHKESDELSIVTDYTFDAAIRYDIAYEHIELNTQLLKNGITVARILKAVEKYVECGVQANINFRGE